MRKGALPRELDLRGLAAREANISGEAALTDLGRLMSAGVGLVAPAVAAFEFRRDEDCLLYTSPSPRDRTRSRMPSSA